LKNSVFEKRTSEYTPTAESDDGWQRKREPPTGKKKKEQKRTKGQKTLWGFGGTNYSSFLLTFLTICHYNSFTGGFFLFPFLFSF
jgi:hypothetical protein